VAFSVFASEHGTLSTYLHPRSGQVALMLGLVHQIRGLTLTWSKEFPYLDQIFLVFDTGPRRNITPGLLG